MVTHRLIRTCMIVLALVLTVLPPDQSPLLMDTDRQGVAYAVTGAPTAMPTARHYVGVVSTSNGRISEPVNRFETRGAGNY